MRTVISFLASLALLALVACAEPVPEPGPTEPAALEERVAQIHKLADDKHMLIIREGTDAIAIRLDNILDEVLVYKNGQVNESPDLTDLPFTTPCPCCKTGCDEYCIPNKGCDGTGMDFENHTGDVVCELPM